MNSPHLSLFSSRRGLSSIVGALLFVVLMVSAFAVIGVALNSQTDISSTGRDVAAKNLEKQQESFVLNNIQQGPGALDYLEIDLTNKGQNIAEMFTVVMTNKSDTGEPTRTFEIPSSTSFLPVGDDDPTNIVSTLNLKMNVPTPGIIKDYDFKVISSLGTIKTMSIQCDGTSQICGVVPPPSAPGTPGLSAQLFLDGPNGVNTKTSTVIMFVQNTGSVPLEDVYPTRDACLIGTYPTIIHGGTPIPGLGDFTCAPPNPTPGTDAGCGSALIGPNNNDGNGICLAPGQSAIFKWDGTVSGDVGDVFTFCNSVSGEEYDNTLVGPTPLTCDTLEVIDPNDCGGCGQGDGGGGESIIILDDLLIRPSIFLTLPSPFGSTGSGGSYKDHVGVFGVQVANPTNSTFSVSKVTLTAFAPGANNNILIFDNAGTTENILPDCCTPLTGDWILSDENVVVWRDYTNPVVLPPYSANSFLLKVKPATNSKVLESVIVQSSVFSSIGSFGKAGYQTTHYPSGGTEFTPIANVFLATTPNTVATNSIIGHKLNLVNGTTSEFIVTLADMDKQNASYIKTGAKLVINIPRQWEFVNIDQAKSSTKFIFNATEPKVIEHGDGSTQIIALTNENLGDVAASTEAASIVFNAKAPNEENDRMYIMYLLGDGLTEDNYSVGPQQESILHVIGNVTGYP